MLKQLARLSVEADGRYATDQELQFLEDYLQCADQRISVYEKVRDAEEEILDQVGAKMLALDPKLFHKGTRDCTYRCKRDRKYTLRCSAAAMLVNDLERLRDKLLLWQRTIVNAFNDQHPAHVTHKAMQEVIEQHLTPEEAALFLPALQLNQALLGE